MTGWRRTQGRMLGGAAVALALLVAGGGVAVADPGDTVTLGVAPTVPKNGGSFQVRASGSAASGEASVYLTVILAPRSEPCQPTAALAEATYFDHQTDDRWGRWWENWIDATYDEAKVFDGRPTGKYRLCGYLNDYDTDPMATTRVDFTIGGTCKGATKRIAKSKKQVKRSHESLRRAKKALRRAKAHDRPKRVLRKKQRKVERTAHRVDKAKKQLRKARVLRKKLC